MSLRAVLIFFYGLLLVRFAGKRVFGKNTSFDIVLGVILGSILSRALTGNAPFIPALIAATVLVLLHKLIAAVAFRSPGFGHVVKGTEDPLIENGKILWRQMKKNSFTEHDLKEALRSSGGVVDLSGVKAAYLERSGDISVIK
jgi:uncharacterized membrane protein YcaP (DUF421 family)